MKTQTVLQKQQELFEELQPQGCVAVYVTGSTANPYIKNPRDIEFYAVFGTYEQAKVAKKIYNVHNVDKNWKPKRFFIWGYLHHYLNEANDQEGEKVTFEEPEIQQLVNMANALEKCYDHKAKIKNWYHVAMVKAIEKYGYDSIPEQVVSQINDLHDLKITYDQFELGE